MQQRRTSGSASLPGPVTGGLRGRGAWCDAERRLHLGDHGVGEPGLAQPVEITSDCLLPHLAGKHLALVSKVEGPGLTRAVEVHERVGAVAVDPDELRRKRVRALRGGKGLLKFTREDGMPGNSS